MASDNFKALCPQEIQDKWDKEECMGVFVINSDNEDEQAKKYYKMATSCLEGVRLDIKQGMLIYALRASSTPRTWQTHPKMDLSNKFADCFFLFQSY